ncbi:MAG: hypothetical protein QOE41_646 [Mycobacterium sp.]|nr:hypothetical protein [Mycobacterium sp.]
MEHAPAPLLVLGMVTVPVTPLGTGLTVGDAPSCKPFAPTGAPGTVPSEEVTPSDGVTVPTWANAGLQHNKSPAVAMINNGLMEDPPIAGRVTVRAHAGTAVGSAAKARAFIFMIADRG